MKKSTYPLNLSSERRRNEPGKYKFSNIPKLYFFHFEDRKLGVAKLGDAKESTVIRASKLRSQATVSKVFHFDAVNEPDLPIVPIEQILEPTINTRKLNLCLRFKLIDANLMAELPKYLEETQHNCSRFASQFCRVWGS